MTTQSVSRDLDYLRSLAESGRAAPPLGGRYLAWWGALLSATYFGHYLLDSGLLSLQQAAFAWLWTGFGLIGYGGHFVLGKSYPKHKPGEHAVGNRVERAVWKAAGAALLGYFLALAIKSLIEGAAAQEFAFSLPLVFTVYGIAMWTTGAMAESRILQWSGAAALALVPLTALTTGLGVDWLIAAAGVAATALLPGILLMRREPAETDPSDAG